MSVSNWPREDLSVAEKKQDSYYKTRLDYAESIVKTNNSHKDRLTRFFDGYLGIKPAASLEWVEKTYGKENRAKFIPYRLSKTKIDLLWGEQLRQPLQATVTTINSEAMSEKMRQFDLMKGAQLLGPAIEQIKANTGVDVMEGAPIPKSDDDPVWKQMSFKDKCEDIMQIILNNQVKDLDVKRKIGNCFKNTAISSHCFCKVERNENGDIELWDTDPRQAIYEAIEGDDYLEKSPVMGCLQTLPVHSILMRYQLTEKQRSQLEDARQNPQNYIGVDGLSRGFMRVQGGELVCDVLHIEWKSVTPEYYKIVPKTASQLALDPSEPTLTFQLEAEKYEANIEIHKKKVAAGEYEIETKFKQEAYEATRIGGIIDVNCRPCYFQWRSPDNPSYVLKSSYFGYIHGRTSGITVPLQQIMENFDTIYDITMYQILKDLARAKGKIIGIDRAALDAKQTLEKLMYQMTNDQIFDFNSAAAGNVGARNIDGSRMLSVVDLGLSDSFQQLLLLRESIRNELDRITGISENRMGYTAASSTATAQQSDISNSRTITESLFYGFSGFVSRVMEAIVNYSAISWAFYKIEKGEQILGSEKFGFLQAIQEIGYRQYGVHIEDGSKYMEISQRVEAMMELSLNAKEIRPMDALNVLLAETLSEKKAFLRKSWEEMQAAIQASQERELQVQQQMAQQQNQTQLQLAQENREDLQANEKDNIVLAGEMQMEVDNNQARNKMFEQNLKGQQEATNKGEQSL